MFDFASYHRAATLADAINLLADNPQAKLLAGGTDVLIQLHHHNDRYRHIVDIHNLAELRGITLAEDGSLRIGSATTFTQLIEDPITQRHLPALCAAATFIAGPQIRNVATYGGNICNGATSADSATPTLIYDAK
ncbi:FAD binding domain-containing protein, partial [Shigella flexneri]